MKAAFKQIKKRQPSLWEDMNEVKEVLFTSLYIF